MAVLWWLAISVVKSLSRRYTWSFHHVHDVLVHMEWLLQVGAPTNGGHMQKAASCRERFVQLIVLEFLQASVDWYLVDHLALKSGSCDGDQMQRHCQLCQFELAALHMDGCYRSHVVQYMCVQLSG